jgi:tRNA threonylcarbamoyladenosine biosynthesis protein TsaB
MIVLGIDTSTARSSVALLDARDDRVLAAAAHEDARGHGTFLAPAIVRCLADADLTVADLAGVAVGTGPGLYTGLRIGMATATALAWVRGLPIAGVVGTDAVALAARRDDGVAGPVVVVLDARRGQWFHATYAAVAAGGARTTGPAVGDAAAVAAALAAAGPTARLVGEPDPLRRPDAADVARLALADLRAGGTPPEALTPQYLREADVRIGWTERGVGPAVDA